MALHYDHGRWQNNRGLFLKFGLALGISICIIIFQIEVRSTPVAHIDYSTHLDLFVLEVPRTKEVKKELPPPPPPKLKPITFTIDIEPEPVDEVVERKEVVDQPENTEVVEAMNMPVETPEETYSAPIVEPIVEVPDETLYTYVDRMPCYEECLEELDASELKKCTDKRLMQQIYDRLKYPAIALQNGVEGTVVASFTVSKNGKIEDVEILRDIGAGCGKAVKQVIESLEDMIPGKHRGRPVNVSYKMPVKFEQR